MTDRQTGSKKPWEPMAIEDLGDVSKLVLMPGGGKVSAIAGDSGDPRKPPGSEP